MCWSAQVEGWVTSQGTEWLSDSWDELKHIRQAVAFIMIDDKPNKTLEDITQNVCPALSFQQLYRISTLFHDDMSNTKTVSKQVNCKHRRHLQASEPLIHTSRSCIGTLMCWLSLINQYIILLLALMSGLVCVSHAGSELYQTSDERMQPVHLLA